MPHSDRSFPYCFTEREPVGFESSTVVFPISLRTKRRDDRIVTSAATTTDSSTDTSSHKATMNTAMAARRRVAASAARCNYSPPIAAPEERRIPAFTSSRPSSTSSNEAQRVAPTTVLPKLSCMLKREFVGDSEDDYYSCFPSMSKQPPKRTLSDVYDSSQLLEIEASLPRKRSYSAERQFHDQPTDVSAVQTTSAHNQLRNALLSRYAMATAASSSVEDRFQKMRPHTLPSMPVSRVHQRPSVAPGYEIKLREGLTAGSHSPTFATNGLRDRTLEAASELLAERSPRKREAITKLLVKSKEFLSPTSLVRNRNNEIDWVATFLSVGFEPNSIYSLMCPLRKGRWKVEEERFTLELLRLIEIGTIRLRPGQSIRGFIAKKLHSDDMRVLKKLSNCKMFHFARAINPRMMHDDGSDSGASHEYDATAPSALRDLARLEQLKNEFLRSVQLEALVAVRKYLSDSSIRELLNGQDRSSASSELDLNRTRSDQIFKYGDH